MKQGDPQELVQTLKAQPPSGGCVLKPYSILVNPDHVVQPPSGGCVLKLVRWVVCVAVQAPAAFRRLCVETKLKVQRPKPKKASRLQAAVC